MAFGRWNTEETIQILLECVAVGFQIIVIGRTNRRLADVSIVEIDAAIHQTANQRLLACREAEGLGDPFVQFTNTSSG